MDINSNGTGGGNSNSTSSWSGGSIPVEGDKVTILAGDTITMNDTHIWGDDSTSAINISGILKASRTASSSLTCKGNLIGKTGGGLDYGKDGDSISSSYTHDIILNYSGTLADIKYGFHSERTADFSFFMYGAERTVNALTTSEITAGSSSVDVDDVTGWAVGDKVVLATTGGFSERSQYDVREIQGISGNTVTFTTNVTYIHAIGCRIGNFSSNISVSSYNTAYQAFCWFESYTSQSADSRGLDYVSFDQIGGSGVTASGVTFDTGANGLDVWSSGVNNCSFYRENTAGASSPCIELFDVQKKIEFNGCALIGPETTAIYTYQSSVGGFTDCVIYYAGSSGVNSGYSAGGLSCTFDGCTFIGAGSMCINGSLNAWRISNCTILAANSICGANQGGQTIFSDCTFGTATQPNYYQLRGPIKVSTCKTLFIDCTFAEPEYSFTVNIMGYIENDVYECKISNKNVDPSQQEIYKGQGAIYRDNSIYNSSPASLRLEPVSATVPITFDLQIFAPTGLPVTVSGYLRKNSTYGSSNLPYVKLFGLGITADTFTMTDVDDTWVQFKLQGTQTTGTDGMLTLRIYAQSSGTDAKAWVDSIVAPPPQAVNSGNFGFWANGLPVSAIIANYTAASDVWNTMLKEVQLPGSVGARLKENGGFNVIKTE